MSRSAESLQRLPHGPSAHWVQQIVSRGQETIVCRGKVPPDSPLIRNRRLPTVATLELAAQAAALLELGDGGGKKAAGNVGYVVRARRVQMHQPSVPWDRELEVEARRTGAAPPLRIYEVRVVSKGELLLAGSITTFVEDGPETRPSGSLTRPTND